MRLLLRVIKATEEIFKKFKVKMERNQFMIGLR